MKWFFELESEHELDREQADKLREFYRLVPVHGSIGNVTLREQLGITDETDEEYWRLRQILIDGGKISKARGKGGSVRRIPQEEVSESDLERPMWHEIKTRWARARRYTLCEAKITARLGRKPTGRWSRPDITLLGGRNYPNLPGGKFLDVVTFEIKPWFWLEGVYEALAHQRRANLSYLICFNAGQWGVPQDHRDSIAVQREAERQGVGLIVAPEADHFETWDERVEPTRFDPDPHDLDEFLQEQVGELLDALHTWLAE
ncbi:MAG: hypothetical protein OXH05_02650 [Acidobacteria bacterium]|nr:hypothetical protein [Acidobacteriota bacterium]